MIANSVLENTGKVGSNGKEKEPKFNKFNRIKVFHEGFQGKHNEGRRDRGKACRK